MISLFDLALALMIVGLPGQLFAATEAPVLKFGPEFTFGSDRADGREAVLARQIAHLIDNQPEGAKFTRNFFRLISPNGWSFNMATDPGVIEVQMAPETAATFRRFKDDMQDAIFVSAANEGFFPQLFRGGGHINVGLEAFADHDLLLRNFVVDLYNQNQLFMGVFSYDTNSAISYALLSGETQKKIRDVIARFDRGDYERGTVGQMRFLVNLRDSITGSFDDFGRLWGNGSRGKNVAVAFYDVGHGQDNRIEIRAVRPQASMDVWVRQIELLQGRVNHLSRWREPIPLKMAVPLEHPVIADFDRHGLNPPIQPRQALEAFHRYVLESGQRWRDHRDYLWPEWISTGHVTAYESSTQFRLIEMRYKIHHACERFLEAAE